MDHLDAIYGICQNYIRDNSSSVDMSLLQKVSGYCRSRDVERLSTCSLHFDWLSHSVDDWRFLRQVEAFFKKNSLFAEKARCRQAAEDSFKESERQCADTNRRLLGYVDGTTYFDGVMGEYILEAKRYISTVLGPFDDFLSDLPNLVKVTPGATASSPRRKCIPQYKMRLSPYCTNRAKKYLEPLYRYFGFERFKLRSTYANRVELVPKNWKTDRTIACEPMGNLPLQLAFDTYAKRKLRRFGIDLRDQSANKKKARHASVYDDYVTVDFKSASDTVSYNTVALLFPGDWFNYLADVRSPFYRGAFGEGVYSKFSSMGNGSTFCIETLLFAAVCSAVGSSGFLVYGDDVIIERKYYEDFVALAKFLGFTVNEAKSFSSGPFRESCGGDYFNGVDVTPVYIRGLSKRKASWCHLINALGRLTFPGSELLDLLAKIVEEEKLPAVPYVESTLAGIWIDPAEARRRGILKRKILREGGPRLYYFRAYVPYNERRDFQSWRGYYLWFLYKNAQASFAGPWEVSTLTRFDPIQTSSVPVFQHRYVRRWVSWFPPAEAMPDHILWSDKLCPRSEPLGVARGRRMNTRRR